MARVLVAGGGITGLTSALFLAKHGVPCVLVEKRPGLLIHPRARGLTPRTMEIYRQAGLEQAILDAASAGPAEPDEDDGSGASPCGSGPIDQDRLEVLVRDRAAALGAELRFGTELTAYEQSSSGVIATLRSRGGRAEEEKIEADYLIAADGVNSRIRTGLGIGVDGPGSLFHTLTALVDADLTPALRGRTSIAYPRDPRQYTILTAHGGAGRRWVFWTGYDPERESLHAYDDKRVAGMVREAAGLPDVEVVLRPQVPGTDLTVLAFPVAARLARRYRSGRVFLAGDAAHTWPPTGGFGANCGIQDAHNLAWKLASVLSGEAGPGLLDSYDPERRPVGRLTMEQALSRFGSRPDLARIDYGAVSMGHRYGGGREPVLPADLSGEPGTRAPHVPLPSGSTLDLYGERFVLLTGPSSTASLPSATVHRLDAASASAHGLGPAGTLLVRPDGFVAWRSPDGTGSVPAAYEEALWR